MKYGFWHRERIAACMVLIITLAQACTSPEQTSMTLDQQYSTGSGNADVTFVRAVQTATDTWMFYVTVQHPDTGWDDYADGWDVVLPDGSVVKPDPDSNFTRLLLHPHIEEQPFTRSQSGIILGPEVTTITIRAHDLVDGYGGREVVVDLTQTSGQQFVVQRQP